MIIFHEISLDETSILVENVIVWRYVKNVAIHAWVVVLNFVLHHKCQVAEGKGKAIFEKDPVVIFEVDFMSFSMVKSGGVLFQYELIN